MTVSVILPTYNRAPLIADAVATALAQAGVDVEVIVVDDGSTDATAAVIAARFGGDARVRYLPQANGGVAAARNAGIAAATGEHVAFLDSDDRWQPWKLAAQLAVLRALAPHGVEMVWTDLDVVDPAGEQVRARALRASYSSYALFARHGVPIFTASAALGELAPGLAEPPASTPVRWGDVFTPMATGNLCQPSTVLLTRARLAAAGGFDESMRTGEDHAFHLAVARVGPCALLDAPAVRYQKGHADQLTRRELKLMIAQNYLRTIAPVLARDRDRIALPPALEREMFAEAHAWLGEELLAHGERAAARRHLASSLRRRPWQPRTALQLIAASAPPVLISGARRGLRAYRALRAARRARAR